MRLRYVRNGLEGNRVLFTGRRRPKSAVGRNRLRRRGRELYRQVKDRISQGIDIAVMIDSADCSFSEQLEDLRTALVRLGLVNGEWND